MPERNRKVRYRLEVYQHNQLVFRINAETPFQAYHVGEEVIFPRVAGFTGEGTLEGVIERIVHFAYAMDEDTFVDDLWIHVQERPMPPAKGPGVGESLAH